MLILFLCASENVGRLVTPAKKLEDTIRLAELVIEVLQQNEEHHAEVGAHIPAKTCKRRTCALTHMGRCTNNNKNMWEDTHVSKHIKKHMYTDKHVLRHACVEKIVSIHTHSQTHMIQRTFIFPASVNLFA